MSRKIKCSSAIITATTNLNTFEFSFKKIPQTSQENGDIFLAPGQTLKSPQSETIYPWTFQDLKQGRFIFRYISI